MQRWIARYSASLAYNLQWNVIRIVMSTRGITWDIGEYPYLPLNFLAYARLDAGRTSWY